jgi:hypothetical protein
MVDSLGKPLCPGFHLGEVSAELRIDQNETYLYQHKNSQLNVGRES